MYKIIVDENGTNQIYEIKKSGAYYDPSKVLWDERTQGPAPAEMVDPIVAAKATADAAAETVEVAKRTAREDFSSMSELPANATLPQLIAAFNTALKALK